MEEEKDDRHYDDRKDEYEADFGKRRKIRRIKIKTIKTVKIRKKTETKTGIKSGIGRRIAGRIGDGIFGMKETDIVKKIWKELRQKELLSDIRRALAL